MCAATSAENPLAQHGNFVGEQLHAGESTPAVIGSRSFGIPKIVARYNNSRRVVLGWAGYRVAATGCLWAVNREQSGHELFLYFYGGARGAFAWRDCCTTLCGHARL